MTKKNTLLFFIFILSHFYYSQEISVENRAKALQYSILTNHVSYSKWNDTLSNLVNDHLIDFLDPNKIYFSKEQISTLKLEAKSIGTDISERKTIYFQAVKELFNNELKNYTELLKGFLSNKLVIKNEKNPKIKDFPSTHVLASELKDKREKFILQDLFQELYKMQNSENQLTETEILKNLEKATKKIIDEQEQIYALFTKDSKFIENYYLEAIALSVDPHTLYFSESIMKSFKDELAVDQERFGFSYGLDVNNKLIITNLLPGSSAWLSGKIKENDLLLEIGLKQNGNWNYFSIPEGLMGMDQVEVLLSNYKEKEVYLILQNESNEGKKVLLKKSKIYNDNELVKNALLGIVQKIAYIQLSDFYTDMSGLNDGNGCANDIAKCIIKLKKDSIKGLILDLRGNGGGSLKEAIELTGIFIDYGPVLTYKDKSGNISTLKDANRGYIYDGPLLILIDEESASASEVVAGALQDYGKALVVGRSSFGKATSQVVLTIDPLMMMDPANLSASNPNFGYVNVTEGVLYRINSQSNQKVGVMPDILIPNLLKSFDKEKENDLDAAITANPISKKINYPISNKIPINELLSYSEEYFKSIQMKEEFASQNSILNILQNENYVYLDYFSYFSDRKKIEKEFDKVFTDKEYLTDSLINSNSFDSMIYEKNEILKNFQKDFESQISNDLELKIAWDLMNKWLTINK